MRVDLSLLKTHCPQDIKSPAFSHRYNFGLFPFIGVTATTWVNWFARTVVIVSDPTRLTSQGKRKYQPEVLKLCQNENLTRFCKQSIDLNDGSKLTWKHLPIAQPWRWRSRDSPWEVPYGLKRREHSTLPTARVSQHDAVYLRHMFKKVPSLEFPSRSHVRFKSSTTAIRMQRLRQTFQKPASITGPHEWLRSLG